VDGFVIFSFIIYLLGIVGWLFIWKIYDGYKLMKEKKALIFIFVMTFIIFITNALLVLVSPIPPFDVELKIYEYVEVNARVLATMSLAIAVFAHYSLSPIKQSFELINYFLFYSMFGFVTIMLGVFPLYWMPAIDGWLTILRHIKTVFYTYSLISITSAIIVFIYTIIDIFSKKPNNQIETEKKQTQPNEEDVNKQLLEKKDDSKYN
jgi:hypothetical protein